MQGRKPILTSVLGYASDFLGVYFGWSVPGLAAIQGKRASVGMSTGPQAFSITD